MGRYQNRQLNGHCSSKHRVLWGCRREAPDSLGAQGMLHTQQQLPPSGVFHVPSSVSSSLHSSTNLLLITTLRRKCYHSHLTDEQTQAQRQKVTCPRPHSSFVLVLRAPDNWSACCTDCLPAEKGTLELYFEGHV